MKTTIQKILNKLGYEINKVQRHTKIPSDDLFSNIKLRSGPVIDLEKLALISTSIPGMISPKSGQFLFAMCYMQELHGDVVEVGSWQGRSTSFLSRAVKHSGNGTFYAIDHFKGNVGKEHHYVVDRPDLGDLEEKFLQNI